jgi:hypothetical protein
MKNSEEAIEKVMAGLRDSEASPGLDLRILAAAKHSASAQSATSRLPEKALWLLTHSSQQKAWRAAVATAAVGLIAAVLAITAIHQHRKPSTQSKFHPDATAVPSPAHAREEAELLQPRPITPASARPSGRATRLVSPIFPIRPHETRNLNHPAPEAPLSQQEKLLQRIAQSGDPHALTMLNPEIRARQDAEDEAEFRKFVEQPTTGN